MSVQRGKDLGGSPMEGMYVEVDGGGDTVLKHGKRQSCAYCHYSNLTVHLYRLFTVFPFHLLEYPVKGRL